MPIANLTDRKVAGLKPGDPEEWWDEKVPGFGVRISAKGKKTWFVMYRFAGLRRRLKLGYYPGLDLEEARKKARNALNEVADGNDPAQQKKDKLAEALRERLEAKTFAELSARYIEEYAKPNKRTWQEDVRILDKHLLPEFGPSEREGNHAVPCSPVLKADSAQDEGPFQPHSRHHPQDVQLGDERGDR